MAAPLRCLVFSSLALALAACSPRQSQDQQSSSTPFVVQALNLQQQNAQGQRLWRVSSPEARYDLSRRIAQARQLNGEIFSNGSQLYKLQASHGIVLNDGEVLQLEGDVTVERLGSDPVIIRAARMRWYPRQQRIELDRRAEAATSQLRLLAQRARLLLDRDLLQLRGQPTLQSKDLRLAVQQLDWSPGSGQLIAMGEAVATTSTPAKAPARALRAAGLRGNTINRTLTLMAPVQFSAPDLRAWLHAQTSVVNIQTNTLQSALPFKAGYGAMAIDGGGFAVDLRSTVATVEQGCRLQQPGSSLTAGRCSWDWTSKRVTASGNVELRRSKPQQITRSRHLTGLLGDQGLVVFSSPGSKVQSTVRLPLTRSGIQRPSQAIRL